MLSARGKTHWFRWCSWLAWNCFHLSSELHQKQLVLLYDPDQRDIPVLSTCHSATGDSKGCSARCSKRRCSHIRSADISVPVRCRQIIKQRRNYQGNGQIHRCLEKEMDKCQASKQLFYYIFLLLKWGTCSNGIVEKWINIQMTTKYYSLQDGDTCYRNAVEFHLARHDKFLHSKTVMLYIKLVYFQCVFSQMHQYFKDTYYKPDGFTDGTRPLWILYHLFVVWEKVRKIALISKIAN